MNNTFNYSFLMDSNIAESKHNKDFIPSEVISEKYVNKTTLELDKPKSKKTRLAEFKNSRHNFVSRIDTLSQ